MIFYAMFFLLVFFIAIRVPIAMAVGGASLFYIICTPDVQPHTAVQRMVGGVNSYTLLAIPFFIFAGNVMNYGGVTTRIFDFATACVGHIKGGLAHVNVLASIIFAGMSGAAVADAGGLGAIEIRAMKERGYGEQVTIGVTAASSLIGPIIPPSMPMVVYAVAASASLGRLFAAGVIPGLLMGASLMILIYLQADKLQCPRETRVPFRRLAAAFYRAFLSLMAPVIILGGMFTGWFTPTESAAIASFYGIILGLIYRDLDYKTMKSAIIGSMTTTIQILLIVGSATLFAYVLAREEVPQQVAAWVLSITDNYWVVLLMLNILLLAVGLFMETVASINLLVPVFLPLFEALHINPVHFGLVMCVNLLIGTLTPPFGSVLFVLSSVSNISVEKVFRHTAIFIWPLLIVRIILIIFPEISLWLPNLLFGPE
ncbi:MAG: TRAP transporter large permease [Planctomycetota bacterium]|jgi:tripartite ATP-independent transporter DctM subunit|nr:TRAP transporter large permease [Planctomycetota bacterium]